MGTAEGSSGAAAPKPLALDRTSVVWQGDLDGMLGRRMIRVLVPYSKTLYFVDYGGQQRGMSYDFIRAFEQEPFPFDRRSPGICLIGLDELHALVLDRALARSP